MSKIWPITKAKYMGLFTMPSFFTLENIYDTVYYDKKCIIIDNKRATGRKKDLADLETIGEN